MLTGFSRKIKVRPEDIRRRFPSEPKVEAFQFLVRRYLICRALNLGA